MTRSQNLRWASRELRWAVGHSYVSYDPHGSTFNVLSTYDMRDCGVPICHILYVSRREAHIHLLYCEVPCCHHNITAISAIWSMAAWVRQKKGSALEFIDQDYVLCVLMMCLTTAVGATLSVQHPMNFFSTGCTNNKNLLTSCPMFKTQFQDFDGSVHWTDLDILSRRWPCTASQTSTVRTDIKSTSRVHKIHPQNSPYILWQTWRRDQDA